jgi:hypothetical protein
MHWNKWAAVVLLVLVLALAAVLGRRLERWQDAGWKDAAERVQGRFLEGPASSWAAAFGPRAPWHTWARDGSLQIPRAIDAPHAQPPFALLQVRYSIRAARGETESESWYEVAVAAVRVPSAEDTAQPTRIGEDYLGTVRDGTLFAWKQDPRGAGAPLSPKELPALLQQARDAATRLSPGGPSTRSAASAGPAPASRRTPP